MKNNEMKWMKLKCFHAGSNSGTRGSRCASKTHSFTNLMWLATSLVKAGVDTVKEQRPMEVTTRCHASARSKRIKQNKWYKKESNARLWSERRFYSVSSCAEPEQALACTGATKHGGNHRLLHEDGGGTVWTSNFFPDSTKIYINRKLLLRTLQIEH